MITINHRLVERLATFIRKHKYSIHTIFPDENSTEISEKLKSMVLIQLELMHNESLESTIALRDQIIDIMETGEKEDD